ncbi:MAG: bifunctional pyr operon transcriptional regulator/uracil phosphoribosyltransferase PyrR [Candidatus Zixiibacteriota bacterium]
MTAKNKLILDDKKIERALARIAHEILERNGDVASLAIVGILTRGAHLARRIALLIEKLEGVAVPVGLMDISLYRDDVHQKLDQPVIQRTDIIFPVKDKNIILVDDVLFTGRTIRAALNHIVDFGRPRTIQLAVLVDRGHRELPIKADYVGVNIPTSRSDQVVLEVKEKEGVDQVYVAPGGGKAALAPPGGPGKKQPAPARGRGEKSKARKSAGKGGKA